MKAKMALVACAVIASLTITPQAFPAGKSGLIIKKAGRSSTSIPNTILSGTGIPAKTIGIDGDFYIDIKNANLYGPKTKGVWKLATSLRVVDTKQPSVPIAGVDGSKGNTGEQGIPGPIGATGPAGIKGADGAKGATGLTGATGFTGSSGSIGATGLAGTSGLRGETGLTGSKGDTGNSGSNGTDGAPGAQGNRGTDGTNGTPGAAGADGAPGAAGADGASGSSTAYWKTISFASFVPDYAGALQDSVAFFTIPANGNYTFEVMLNGLLPLTNVEDMKFNARVVCTPSCSSISQYVIASNSISNANLADNKQFGMRIMGVISNGAALTELKIQLTARAAVTSVADVQFAGSALINKVGSVG